MGKRNGPNCPSAARDFDARRSGPTVQLGRSDLKRLERLGTTTGLSNAELVGAALATLEGVGRVDAATAYRLDQLTRRLEGLERDQTILIEMLALFIRDYLSGTAADPEPQQEAVRALGRVRFEHFIEQLVRHFQKGNSFVRDVEEGFASEPGPEGSGKLRDAVPA